MLSKAVVDGAYHWALSLVPSKLTVGAFLLGGARIIGLIFLPTIRWFILLSLVIVSLKEVIVIHVCFFQTVKSGVVNTQWARVELLIHCF